MVRQVIRYSEAFKIQVVSELENGKFKSAYEAQLKYGIRGCGTILKWQRKYGTTEEMGKVIRVETVKEREQLKESQKRIRELEALVADMNIDLRLERNFLKYACESGGLGDVEAFKKKHAGPLHKKQ